MSVLIAGLLMFFGVHSIAIVSPDLRDRLRGRLGPGAWRGLYSLGSLFGLVLICYGFSLARRAPIVLYTPPAWLRYAAIALLLPVFPLLFAAYLPGRIKRATKHPMLAGIECWALAHLLANGRLADLLLFGGFLAWAVADRISLKRRPPQALRAAAPRAWNDVAAIGAGLAVYVLLIAWAHLRLFGVAPLH